MSHHSIRKELVSIGLGLSLLSFPGLPLRAQDTLRAKPKWHQAKAFRTLAAPVLLAGYGLSAVGSHGFPYSSQDAYRDAKRHFPRFHTQVDDVAWALPVVAVYGLNATGIKGKHPWVDCSVLYFLSAGLANGITLGLKEATHRIRPDGSSDNSFPSGHTTNAFVAAEFLHQEYKDQSPWYSVAGYSVAAATGAMRILNQRHWLSDVFTGAGIGMLSTKAVYLVYPILQGKTGRASLRRMGLFPTYQSGRTGFYLVLVFS